MTDGVILYAVYTDLYPKMNFYKIRQHCISWVSWRWFPLSLYLYLFSLSLLPFLCFVVKSNSHSITLNIKTTTSLETCTRFVLSFVLFWFGSGWFTHILQDCFTGIRAILWWLPQCLWSKIEAYGSIDRPPANTRRNNNVIIASKRCCDVVLTT